MKDDFSIYREEILKYEVIPEILEAVRTLVKADCDESSLWVGFDDWYELDGERLEFISNDSSLETSVTTDLQEDSEYMDMNMIHRISGMPLIELVYYADPVGRKWNLDITFECSDVSDKNGEPSIYSLFRKSRFQSMFRYDTRFDGIYEANARLNQDIEMAAKLISYYIRYYGCDQDDRKYKIGMNLNDDDESDLDSQTQVARSANIEEVNIALYGFEFKYLPMVAREVLLSESGQKTLRDKDYMLGFRLALSGYVLPIDEKDIRIDLIGDGLNAVVVWTMPYPEDVPLARYIAFFPDLKANKYIVYSLERTYDFEGKGTQWILGEVNQNVIFNYGFVDYPFTPEEFVALVRRHIESKNK